MKIALWSSNYFRGFGGAEKIVHDILNNLNLPVSKILLIGNKRKDDLTKNQYFSDLPKTVQTYQNTFTNPLLFRNKPLLFLWKLILYLKASLQLAFFLSRQNVKIFHLHFVSLDVILIILLKFIFKYKLVLTFTGMELNLAENSSISRVKLRLALKYADIVTAVSREICSRLKNEYQFREAIFVPNGVVVDQEELLKKKNLPDVKKNAFVFCGRLQPVKNLLFLVEAFKECLEQGCDNILYLVGEGPERANIEQWIKTNHLEERILMLGALKHEEVLAVVIESKCLVLSSKSEGCPLVVLEAMAMGKPVIASNVGGLNDLILHRKDGLLYPKDQKEKLVEAILEIESSFDFPNKIGKAAARKIDQQFSLNTMVNKYERLYHQLL